MMDLARIPVIPTRYCGGVRVLTNLCVWHSTAGGTLRSSMEWVARDGSTSGFHFGIERDGALLSSTPVDRIGWHAGESAWPVPPAGVPQGASVNRRSIGIEFANSNDGREQVTSAQITAAMDLAVALAHAYPSLRDVKAHVRHRDISPGRKTDPLPSTLSWTAFQARLAAVLPPLLGAA